MDNKFRKISEYGEDFLDICKNNGLYYNHKGQAILQQLEDFLNGKDITNEELAEAAQLWKDGKFCQGYYYSNNDGEFAEFLRLLCINRII